MNRSNIDKVLWQHIDRLCTILSSLLDGQDWTESCVSKVEDILLVRRDLTLEEASVVSRCIFAPYATFALHSSPKVAFAMVSLIDWWLERKPPADKQDPATFLLNLLRKSKTYNLDKLTPKLVLAGQSGLVVVKETPDSIEYLAALLNSRTNARDQDRLIRLIQRCIDPEPADVSHSLLLCSSHFASGKKGGFPIWNLFFNPLCISSLQLDNGTIVDAAKGKLDYVLNASSTTLAVRNSSFSLNQIKVTWSDMQKDVILGNSVYARVRIDKIVFATLKSATEEQQLQRLKELDVEAMVLRNARFTCAEALPNLFRFTMGCAPSVQLELLSLVAKIDFSNVREHNLLSGIIEITLANPTEICTHPAFLTFVSASLPHITPLQLKDLAVTLSKSLSRETFSQSASPRKFACASLCLGLLAQSCKRGERQEVLKTIPWEVISVLFECHKEFSAVEGMEIDWMLPMRQIVESIANSPNQESLISNFTNLFAKSQNSSFLPLLKICLAPKQITLWKSTGTSTNVRILKEAILLAHNLSLNMEILLELALITTKSHSAEMVEEFCKQDERDVVSVLFDTIVSAGEYLDLLMALLLQVGLKSSDDNLKLKIANAVVNNATSLYPSHSTTWSYSFY